ncbi:hypothetical protein E2C01_085923 [Portunus trituberculatus]|uniref:Secreted protein n=1 Tax=Portunus trituberculatus TaxID=210409 RepID=A0A5B7J7Y5_PORTR|nr:hypothetical protein [Portunus trituberculatus]
MSMVTLVVVTATGAVAALHVRTEWAWARVSGLIMRVLETTDPLPPSLPPAELLKESSMIESESHHDTLG